MKALWLVSFRPIGKSKINDFFQSIFLESIMSIDFDITFSLTQFDEENVKDFVEKKKIKNHYINISKNELPKGKKYSNHLMLRNALNQFIDNDYQYLICSSADIIVPNNIFKIMSKINKSEFCALIYPNIHITNGIVKNNYWPHYGIDLIAFKITKETALRFQELSKNYKQYDWGIIENFYISVSEALKLERINLFKHSNTIKFDNDFLAFSENRESQKIAWKENQKYFLDFLKENRLSKLYAYGSYYYLLYKIFRFRDFNYNLFLSYLIFYPYNIFKKLIKIILRKK
tara:strand:- start:591 stop:1454 length:864 start_codon:yes stop_codon:yes gene_type:complete